MAGDEFELIEAIRHHHEATGGTPPPDEVWIGDDAAVVAGEAGPLLLATDLVVAGVHTDPDVSSAADLGYKAMAVTVSDLAAMGARPRWALVSVAGPPGSDPVALSAGVAEAAAELGCAVVGGDLSAAPAVTVSVAVAGVLVPAPPAGPGPLLRAGARAGDTLWLTGPLGSSAAGLRLARSGVSGGTRVPAAALIAAHRRPRARVAEGEAARLAGAGAAIDISDGLVADARHLAVSSGVGLELAGVPVTDGATEAEALTGGEDYELLVATADGPRLVAAFAAAGLRPPVAIGVCTPDAGRHVLEGGPLPPGGWRHRFGTGGAG